MSAKSALHPEEVPDQASTVSFLNRALSELSRAMLSDEASSKLSEEVVYETPPEAWSIMKMIKDTQELDPQCRQIVSWFHVYSQIGAPLALEPRSVL